MKSKNLKSFITEIIKFWKRQLLSRLEKIIIEVWYYKFSTNKFNETVLSVLDKHAPKKKRNIYVQKIAILWLKNWEKQLWTDQNQEIST